MKRKKIKSLLAAFMIFVTVLFVNVSVTASENNELPDPTDEDIWFRQLDAGTHNYKYYYAGNTALHSWIDIGDVTQEEMDAIEYPATFIGKQGTNTEVMGAYVCLVLTKE